MEYSCVACHGYDTGHDNDYKKGHFGVPTVITCTMIAVVLIKFSEGWISCCRVLNAEIGPEQHRTTLTIVIFILAIPTREELTHIVALSLGILGKFFPLSCKQ